MAGIKKRNLYYGKAHKIDENQAVLKKKLKNNRIVRNLYVIFRLFTINFRLSNLANILWFFQDYILFFKSTNSHFQNSTIHPCLDDKTNTTPIEPTYFFQDSWAARKIFQNRPIHHVDIGSSVKTLSIISQFVPTTMIDIRPIDLRLDSLHFIDGSILSIPFEDKSINSLSSLCVIEHIGLGRYGDTIDAFGSEKAAKELQRVLAQNGNLYISIPVDCGCRVYFNAHRAFTRDYILEIFSELTLVEEKYHYGRKLYDSYDSLKGFGTGLFHFIKREV